MNTHNLLCLARNLRREKDKKIVYDNRVSSWSAIFKKHPLNSEKNESLFHDMAHCKEYWGGEKNSDSQLVLRTGYAWTVMQKIAENSLDDCVTFYDVAKHTMLNKEGILNNSIHNWFKKVISAIYLSKVGAPESLNFFSVLSQKDKEAAIALSFQTYGINAIPVYEKIKEQINIEKVNEKLVLWYWEADGRTKNLLDQVIDELGKSKTLKFDLDYIAENFKPNNLLKYQSLEINQRFIPFSEVTVLTKRYEIKSEKIFCIINQETEKIKLEVIFNLFCCQTLLKSGIGKKLISHAKAGTPISYSDPASFFGEVNYKSPNEIFDAFPISKEARKSMQEFIDYNKNLIKSLKDFEKNYSLSYWSEVQSAYSTFILNEDLKSKNTKKILKKI